MVARRRYVCYSTCHLAIKVFFLNNAAPVRTLAESLSLSRTLLTSKSSLRSTQVPAHPFNLALTVNQLEALLRIAS